MPIRSASPEIPSSKALVSEGRALTRERTLQYLELGATLEEVRRLGSEKLFMDACREVGLDPVRGYALAKVWRAVNDGVLAKETVLALGWRKALLFLNQLNAGKFEPM